MRAITRVSTALAVGLAGCLDIARSGGRVSTASLAQVRRPITDASVGRWRRHARDLAPLIEALGLDREG